MKFSQERQIAAGKKNVTKRLEEESGMRASEKSRVSMNHMQFGIYACQQHDNRLQTYRFKNISVTLKP